MSDPRFTLVEIVDLRDVDWFSGKKIPLAAGEGNECDRCGRMHAVVWKVTDNVTGRLWRVGSGCGPKALGGWEPDKEEIKSARKAARERAEAKRQARIDAEAERIARELSALPEPEIRRGDDLPDGGYKLVMGDVEVWVPGWQLTDSSRTERQVLEERRGSLRGAWWGARFRERLPEGSSSEIRMEIERAYRKIATPKRPVGGKNRHARAGRKAKHRRNGR